SNHLYSNIDQVGNGFSFRLLETTGEMPSQLTGFAHCLYKGNLIIHGGISRPPFFTPSTETFELCLANMTWSRRDTFATQEIRDELSSISIFSEENLIIGDMMNAIEKFSMRKHFVCILNT
ncbi:hypothetical protein PENTCL1PPCAC_9237, partial [Pristionchus entomophagus]